VQVVSHQLERKILAPEHPAKAVLAELLSTQMLMQ
jgi:hypothetical protein